MEGEVGPSLEDFYMTQQFATAYDFGTFEGFNFRGQCAIERSLTAVEVINWNHDEQGEAEFWPSGDVPLVATIFKGQTAVAGSELLELDRILSELDSDSDDSLLRIFYLHSCLGMPLTAIDRLSVEETDIHVFIGSNFMDLRREAAHELFELYYPECYAAWEKSQCDGLLFDSDRFLDSPSFGGEEIRFGEHVALLVTPQ